MTKVLLDTNTLLLLLASVAAPERVGGKRLEAFDQADVARLQGLLASSTVHLSLPNILTEVSNLIGSGGQSWGPKVLEAFARYCRLVDEVYEPSSRLTEMPEFRSIGLTDAAVLWVSKHGARVFTIDFALGNRLSQAGVEVVNLMHYKTPSRRT